MSAAQARRAETRPQTAAETERPTFDKEAEEPGTPDLSRCETCGCDCARAARRAEKGKAKEEWDYVLRWFVSFRSRVKA